MRKPESEFLRGLLASPDRTEALEWLKRGSGKNNIGELSYDESLKIVENLYEWGAVEVSVAKISVVEGFGSTDNVLIGMSDNPESREKIFTWLNELAENMGLVPQPDEGQRYMLAWFD
jgi:DNA-binding transcriptional ArsR family regulator